MGIDAYVVPLGSADPQKKADWIELEPQHSDLWISAKEVYKTF